MTRLGLTVATVLLTAMTASGGGAAPAPPAASATAQWPLQPGADTIVRDFDPPAQPWLAGNRGVDLAGTAGQPVHAATSGVVTFAGQVAGVGVVTVTDGALRTTYEPLQIGVTRGQRVTAGDVLGVLTLTGSHCVPAACLHWGLLRGSDYLDPLALLGLERVVLLPVD